MKLYHGTAERNLISILEEGIKPGPEGCVFLAETQFDALKFLALRCFDEDIIVFEVEVSEEKVEETFDHSYSFFKCKAYGYFGKIEPSMLTTNIMKYPKQDK